MIDIGATLSFSATSVVRFTQSEDLARTPSVFLARNDRDIW